MKGAEGREQRETDEVEVESGVEGFCSALTIWMNLCGLVQGHEEEGPGTWPWSPRCGGWRGRAAAPG